MCVVVESYDTVRPVHDSTRFLLFLNAFFARMWFCFLCLQPCYLCKCKVWIVMLERDVMLVVLVAGVVGTSI